MDLSVGGGKGQGVWVDADLLEAWEDEHALLVFLKTITESKEHRTCNMGIIRINKTQMDMRMM